MIIDSVSKSSEASNIAGITAKQLRNYKASISKHRQKSGLVRKLLVKREETKKCQD